MPVSTKVENWTISLSVQHVQSGTQGTAPETRPPTTWHRRPAPLTSSLTDTNPLPPRTTTGPTVCPPPSLSLATGGRPRDPVSNTMFCWFTQDYHLWENNLKLKIDIFHVILLSYRRNILCRKPLNQIIKRNTFCLKSFINYLPILIYLNFFMLGVIKNIVVRMPGTTMSV